MGRPQDVFAFLGYTPKEASYGAAVANASLTQFHKLQGPGLINLSRTVETDADAIKGHPYTTDGGAVVTEDRVKGSFEFKNNTDLTAFFIILALAKVSTSGISPDFTHVTKWPGSGVDAPWSTSIIQGKDRNQTSSFRKYDGIVPASVEFSIEKPGMILTKVELVGDGSDSDASAVVAPAINSAIDGGDRLYYEHLTTMGFGPAAESVLSIFRKLTVKLNTGLELKPRPDKLTKVAEIHYGKEAPSLEVELVVKGRNGDTVYNYWKNRTKLQFNMLLQKSATRSLQLQGNAVRAAEDAPNPESFDGIDHILTLPLRFEYVTADASPFIWTAKNGIAVYAA